MIQTRLRIDQLLPECRTCLHDFDDCPGFEGNEDMECIHQRRSGFDIPKEDHNDDI